VNYAIPGKRPARESIDKKRFRESFLRPRKQAEHATDSPWHRSG
jgi:hypothetical protein